MNTNIRPQWWALVAWAVVWFVGMAWHGGMAWHFFVQGARALADVDNPVAGGLHLYAAAPILQIGPLAFVVTQCLRVVGGPFDLLAAQVLGAAGGGYILWQASRLSRRFSPWAVVFFVPVWMYLAVGSAHLDDVLVLVCLTGVLAAARAGRGVIAGLLFGLAVDAKPWALGFAALLLLLLPNWRESARANWRAAARAAISSAVVVLAGWLPFFLADSGTTRMLHYTIRNSPLSALRALGFDDARTPPWDRPAQALLGIGLGILAIRRGRWSAIPLLAVAARIAVEPGTNKYYAAGAVVGAVLWDVIGSTARFPWWTASAALTLFASRWLPVPDAVHGWITLAFCLACGIGLIGNPLARHHSPAISAAEPGSRPLTGQD